MRNYLEQLEEFLVLFTERFDGVSGREVNSVPNTRVFMYMDEINGEKIVLGYFKNLQPYEKEAVKSYIEVEKIESYTNKKF